MNNKSILMPLTTVAYSLLVLLGLAEFFFSRGSVLNYLIFDHWMYSAVFLLALLFYRYKTSSPIRSWRFIKFNNAVVFPVSSLLVVSVYVLEAYRHSKQFIVTPELERVTSLPHMILSLDLNSAALVSILVLSYFLKIISLQQKSVKKNWMIVFFNSFLLITFFLYTHYYELFATLSLSHTGFDDDKFMEWLQVAILAFGMLVCVKMALLKMNGRYLRLAYSISALVLFILLGEELSWGERLLPFEYMQLENNTQNEFNLHNSNQLDQVVASLYIGAFVYAFVSWIVFRQAQVANVITKKNSAWWRFFCFRGQEVAYFIPTLLINPYFTLPLGGGLPSVEALYASLGILPDIFKTRNFVDQWKESLEVLFYAGIVIHFFNNYLSKHKK